MVLSSTTVLIQASKKVSPSICEILQALELLKLLAGGMPHAWLMQKYFCQRGKFKMGKLK